MSTKVLAISHGAAAKQPAATQRDSLSSIWLDTGKDDINDALEIHIVWAAALHEPLEHVGILAGQKFFVARLIFCIQIPVGFFQKRNQ